ncbi:hypothetical protein NPIL_382961 [Nephila pilipes]|uniref:Uncharacterized protein n=1 Tax=Nephila pilipes TaxID=299642 RepID=A0A8X6QBK9_NEPPI|nr:hypothetical protein NPIL_382961 [Nephila pilipes]
MMLVSIWGSPHIPDQGIRGQFNRHSGSFGTGRRFNGGSDKVQELGFQSAPFRDMIHLSVWFLQTSWFSWDGSVLCTYVTYVYALAIVFTKSVRVRDGDRRDRLAPEIGTWIERFSVNPLGSSVAGVQLDRDADGSDERYSQEDVRTGDHGW